MKAEEFKRYFTDNNNGDLTSKYGNVFHRVEHQGNYECLLCGRPHNKGLKYIFNNEEEKAKLEKYQKLMEQVVERLSQLKK